MGNIIVFCKVGYYPHVKYAKICGRKICAPTYINDSGGKSDAVI